MSGSSPVAAFVVGLLACTILSACQDTQDAQDTGDALRPNWHQDIAPIVHARCVGCHRAGGVAPFVLDEYAAASQWSAMLTEVVDAGLMPPWGARETPECQPAHTWRNDMRPSAAEAMALADWAALGAPEGDPTLAAPLPELGELTDRALADPTDIFENPTPILLEQVDSHVCVSIDTGIDQDVWVTGVQLLPGNESVVHHVLIMLDWAGESAALAGPDGRYPCDALHLGTMLGSYFPGSFPTEMPDDVGIPFPVGSRIVLNYHYHPTGLGQDIDQSSLAVRWTSDPPAYDALISTLGNATTAAGGLLPGPDDPNGEPAFRIPAGARDHTETMQITVPDALDSVELFMLGPHMHHVGTDLRVTLERDGETHCLLQNPQWNPNWQLVYDIDAEIGSFPRFAAGDVLTLRCTYDNTLDNPSVVAALAEFGLDAPITVNLGAAGLDEMCMIVFGIAVPR
jgi:hypothetical protein